MMTAVDTNILLDVLLEDKEFCERSKQLLEASYEKGSLIIAPEVYAELLTQFLRQQGEEGEKELERFLSDLGIGVKRQGRQSLSEAGRSWLEYTKERPQDKIECPSCGSRNEVACEDCGRPVVWRQHIITDFMIGANAEEHADRILSRDEQFFASYFDLDVLS